MPQLSVESLNFARSHITHFWDSDFYPKPFEFQALWAHWGEVLKYFTGRDVNELPVRSPRTMLASKPGGGYRVVHQLHPLEALAYTALAYIVAPSVEEGRAPADECVACSYRISVDEQHGTFFDRGNGYADFVSQSRRLAKQSSHVLLTDITDFYNQIYLHRLQNAIAASNASLEDQATDVERFLTRINNRVSRGVPVGPAASIIMAEALLTDVDAYILGQGFHHTRYVDDFHVFGESEEQLDGLLRKLVLYLHTNHRLTLAARKTRILPVDEFVQNVIEDPEAQERHRIHVALEAVGPIQNYDFLGADEPSRPVKNPKVEARTNVLQDLMEYVCGKEPLDLGLARHVLRRCRKLRLRAIVPQILEHFERFVPVINDVVLYFSRVTNTGFLNRYADQLLVLSRDSPGLAIDIVAHWWFDYIAQQSQLFRRREWRDVVRSRAPLQAQARLAITTRDIAWVRQYRDRLHDLGSWDRRQVLGAAVVLPRDERRPWLENILESTTDPLEAWVIRWVLSK